MEVLNDINKWNSSTASIIKVVVGVVDKLQVTGSRQGLQEVVSQLHIEDIVEILFVLVTV